jgi:hypothetical protein
MTNKRTYLGDGVYASFDGYQVWLHTWNGIEDTNAIALEPPVLEALGTYCATIFQRKEKS